MKKILFVVLILMFVLVGCSKTSDEPATLTVMVHDSFAVSDEVVAKFEEKYNVDVQFLQSGDTGTAVNKAVLSNENPLADVFYGVDNTFLSRALEGDIFVPYDSPMLTEIPAEFQLDAENRALPVDYGDVCLNVESAYFEENDLALPKSLVDLTKEEYKDLLVVENPATSSPGLAFLFATIGAFGEDGYLDFWQGLVENDVKVVNDWETAYYSDFSMYGGTDPIVVSYGSSPAVELVFAEGDVTEPSTEAIVSPETCFRQIEFVGILKGTEHQDLAEAWVDFMLSPDFQEDMPLQMYVFPVNENAALDPIFVKYLAVAEEPILLDSAVVTENRESWIEAWTETVLR
jgi:thiamine transport system substrate-binding protein